MYRIERSILVKGKHIEAGSIVELSAEDAAILVASGTAIEVEPTKEVEITPKKRRAKKETK